MKLTFKILFSAGKSLIPSDKPLRLLGNAGKKVTCCLPEPLLCCSTELDQARRTECPAVQTMSLVGFGTATRSELARDNHCSSRKPGVRLKVTARRPGWVRGAPLLGRWHFISPPGFPESQQWSLQSEACQGRNVYLTLDHLCGGHTILSRLLLPSTPKWCVTSPTVSPLLYW